MQLLPNLVWHIVGAFNVWSSFKTLKAPSRARKGVPGRGVRERRREVELQVGLYVVWTAFQQVEAIADRTAYFIVPFYDEIKLAVLLWMLASRTVGSDFVYRHLLRPFLATYDRPLELLFSLIFVLFEAALAVTFRPAGDLIAAAVNKAKTRWSGPPPRPGSTAALLSASKETARTEEERARAVVKEAREVYNEIERLQKKPRPLARSNSNDIRPDQDTVQVNAIAGPSSKPLATKQTKRPNSLTAAAPASRRAVSARPVPAATRTTKPVGSVLRPAATAGTLSAEPLRLPRPGATTASGRRISPVDLATTTRKASRKGASAHGIAHSPPRPPLSPPPVVTSADDFLLPDPERPSPSDVPILAEMSALDAISSGSIPQNPAPPAPLDRSKAVSLYPSLPPPPVGTGFASIRTQEARFSPSPGDLHTLLVSNQASLEASPAASTSGSLPGLPVDLEPTIADSPSRLAFELRRMPRLSLPGTPAPPGSFLGPSTRGSARLTPAATTARDMAEDGDGSDDAAIPGLQSASPMDLKPPAPTPKRNRPPSTPATRATPARRAKQRQVQQANSSPSSSLVVDPSNSSGSAKRRKVSERWEYVSVVESDALDQLDLTEGKQQNRSTTDMGKNESAPSAAENGIARSLPSPVGSEVDMQSADGRDFNSTRRPKQAEVASTSTAVTSAPSTRRRRPPLPARSVPTSSSTTPSSAGPVPARTRAAVTLRPAANAAAAALGQASASSRSLSSTTTRRTAAAAAAVKPPGLQPTSTTANGPSARSSSVRAATSKASGLAGGPVRAQRSATTTTTTVDASRATKGRKDAAER